MDQRTTAFSLDEEYPDGGVFQGGEYYIPRPSFGSSKKPSKNDMIYGIFNNEESSEEDTPFKSMSKFLKPKEFEPSEESITNKNLVNRYPNFKKSNQMLYEPTKTIQVKYAGQKKEEENKSNDLLKDLEDLDDTSSNIKDEEESKKKTQLRAKRIFDFKKKKTSHQRDLADYELPEALGSVKKKLKIEKIEKSSLKTSQEARELKDQYGKGFLMIKNLGFEIGKGLGKEKQGILKPLEAVQKTSYNTNFENKLEEKYEAQEKKGVKNEKEMKLQRSNDETEKIVKRWSKSRKNSKKNYLLPQELIQDKVFLNNVPQKIVDMRGPNPVFLEQVAGDAQEKKGVLGEYLLLLKTEYETNKHKLHDTLRKIRTDEDQIMANCYEIKVLEGRANELSNEKTFLSQAQITIKCLQSLSVEEVLSEFSTFCKKNRKKVLEFELYLYFLKELTRKIKAKVSLSTLRADLEIIYPFFSEVSQILNDLFPSNVKIDPLEPMKQGFLTKTPRKLIKAVFESSLLPILRTYITNEFSLVHDSEEMLAFLNKWKHVLNDQFIQNLFDSLIQPKIELEIKEYEPSRQKYPVHIWLYQWLPWLKEDFFHSLSKILQLKFIKNLNNMDIKDVSALNLIKPWKGIMQNELWESLIKRAVLPKLMFLSYEIKIQPKNQNIDPIKSIIHWIEILELKDIELLLENNLLKKLLETLIEWIKMPNKKKEEIDIWYNGWKKFLPPQIVSIGEYFESMKKLIDSI